MKRFLAVGVLVLAVVLIVFVPVFAHGHNDVDAPHETCPPGFDHAHKVHEGGHDDGGHGEHKHVGNDKDQNKDQNGDGYVCVKHAGKDGNTHVHVDNNYRRGQQPE